MRVRAIHGVRAAALALVTAGACLLGQEAWLRGKAVVASRLIDRALDSHLEDGEIHRPWAWADTHPVAELEVPRLGIRRVVLAGATGASLAFGPGHVDGTARPNTRGNCAIAGHRDSWFSFLEWLRPGDEVIVRTAGSVRVYAVADTSVRSMWDLAALEPTDDDRVTLITCYPFHSLSSSSWRYVVVAEPTTEAPSPAA